MNQAEMPGVQIIPDLAPGIFAAYSKKKFNNDARQQFVETCGLQDKTLFTTTQIHSNKIVTVDAQTTSTNAIEADGLITDLSNVVLGIKTADCVPAFFSDEEGRVVAVVHAGWKGLFRGILDETVKILVRDYKVDPKKIRVGFGPFIHGCCYEVGPEFLDFFSRRFLERKNTRKRVKYSFDMLYFAYDQLAGAGVGQSQVRDVGVCTFCGGGEFFSARRGDLKERMFSIITKS